MSHGFQTAGVQAKSARIVRRTAAFTLVEALIALAIAGLAASALALGLHASLGTTHHSLEQTVARGIAEQVIDEAMGKRYAAIGVGPYQTALGPSGYEQAGTGRDRYDDSDDLHGFDAQPPEDRHGVPLGTDDGAGGTRHTNFQVRSDFFANWEQEVEVYYVDEANPANRLPAGNTSNLRAIEVRILYHAPGRDPREITRVRRVFSYIPQL